MKEKNNHLYSYDIMATEQKKEEKQVIYEDVVVGKDNVKVSSASEKSLNDIIDEAKAIFKKVKDAKINIEDEQGKNVLFKKIESEHKNFIVSLPIISKWMIYLDQFSVKALKRFLKANPKLWWPTEDEWISSNINYVADVYKIKNPRMDESRIAQMKIDLTRTLKEETKKFKTITQEVEKEIAKEKKQLTDKKREELRVLLLKKKLETQT